MFAKTIKEKPIVIFDMRYLLEKDYSDQNQVKQVWDELHAVSTLQGIVNRVKPRLYIKYVNENNICIDEYWWNKYRKPGKWLYNKDTLELKSIEDVIYYFINDINGLVVYDPNVAATSNLASSIAGIENLIAVRYDAAPNSLYNKLTNSNIKLKVKVSLLNNDGSSKFGSEIIPDINKKSTGSAKNDAYLWFNEMYLKKGKCNTKYAAYYIDQKWMDNPNASTKNHHTLTNHDFFVSKKAFFFDLSPWEDEKATDDPGQIKGEDFRTLTTLLLSAYNNNKGKEMCYIGGFPAWAFKYTDWNNIGGNHEPVATEWEFSKIIGAYNAFKDADAIGLGALANSSFWMHFPLKEKYPQKWITEEQLKQKGYLTKDGKLNIGNKKLIIFYVGDYDSSSWIAHTTHSIWDDTNRGLIPMMWAISPVLEERMPMVMDNYRETATENDYFVAADNGAGYLNPGMLQNPRPISGLPSGLDVWKNHCKKYYDRWDLSITGFIIDGNAPGLDNEGLECYRSFSKNGIIPQKSPLTLLYKDMPVMRSDYDITDSDPCKAADLIIERISSRNIPFHWFRNILKTPTWYKEVVECLKTKDPNIILLDAPTFFSLYKIYLQENNDAANGLIE
ncbi:MAG: GxGYxYP family putative glycoside hydrolase [Bacteroidales bacterium]|nr:GxGYxYP family putative glycoside hydrolase [Bacteroidales bacterium]